MKKIILIIMIILFDVFTSFAEESKLENLLIELKQAKGDKRVDLLNNISEILRIENPVRAKTYTIEAMQICSITKYYKGKGKALLNLGVTEAILGENDKAESSFKNALELYQSLGDEFGIIAAKINLGHLHSRTGEYKEALVFLTQAYNQSKITGNKEQIAKASNNLGILYSDIGDYNKAIEYQSISSKYSKELKDYDGLANSLNSIGVIYNNINDKDKALYYYYKALDYIYTIQNLYESELIFNNLAIVFSERGDHKKALEYYYKSLRLAERMPNPLSIAISNQNIGNEYTKTGEMDKAKLYINQSIVQFKELDSPSDLAYAYLVRGSYYMDNHKHKEAETDLANSLKIFKELGFLREEKEVLALLSESYMLSNNKSLATKAFQEFKKVSDKQLFEERSSSLLIANAEIAAMTEIERLSEELKFEKERYVRLSLIIFSVLTFIALSITFFFVAKRMSRKLNVRTAELNMMKEHSKFLNESFANDIKEQMFTLGYYIIDSKKNPHYNMMKKSYDKIAHGINDSLIKYNTYPI